PSPPPRRRRRTRSRGRKAATLPPPDLLEPPVRTGAGAHEAELRRQAEVLGRTLADFRVEARVVSVERGPNITTFELELAAGVKINRIASLEQDLALALGVQSVRIVGPTKGRSTLGIEAPNPEQEIVRLSELIGSREFSSKQRAVPLLLGKDARGAPLIADLARMPHLLIAGATGSGKSVCTNAIIVSMLLTRTPAEVRMILIDPKMVELALYDKIPHLLAPVVTDMRQAPAILEWAVEKMEQRYKLLSRAAVRHIRSYNALGRSKLAERLGVPESELEERAIPWHMPYIVVVIDEFADLMCVARKEVETSVVRLAQKSRAVGIHLILATQRPTADVITGLIKSNMPCRIAFQVASKLDSRTIIDRNGAETLVGQGDMLYLPPGTSRLVRAQGAYVSDEEVKAVVEHVKGGHEPEYDAELLRAGRPGAASAAPSDPLFDDAVRIVLGTGRGSASLLQRQLEIGYSRASRLIDQMTEQGILGPFKGSKAREILMTLEQWEQMRTSEADA
ncbi:MAG: DNA translocase FtsK, partial [Planctomycetota bacterium]